MRFRRLNDEVIYAEDLVVKVRSVDIQWLIEQANKNPRRRVRLCTHPTNEDLLHEMFIVHTRGTYIRPHRHLNKSETVHVIDGKADIILFDENGSIVNVIKMADYRSGGIFYYRMSESIYHTLLIRSEILVFHEITNGPFYRKDTLFAPWTPMETDVNSISNYLQSITNLSRKF